MALVLKDRVKETTTTTGTGTLTLAGAMSGFQAFSVIGNTNTTYYAIYEPSGTAWEVGIGTYTLAGTTLSRDTILASSNAGAAVNFGAGTKVVFCTYPAGKSVYLDAAGAAFVDINGTVGATTPNTGAFTTVSATGVVTVSAGAVGAPSIISTTGTSDTGQWFPAADTIAWSTAGSERMRISSAGAVGIGTTSLTGFNLRVTKNITGAINAFGIVNDGQIQTDVTDTAYGIRSRMSVVDAATVPTIYAMAAEQATLGAGATVTNQLGFVAGSSLTGATNNYGFYGSIASGTGRWNLYMNGTAQNAIAGKVVIGSTTSPTELLELSGNNTGLTSDTALNTLRFVDVDTSTAADQPLGKLEFYGSDATSPGAGVKSYILSASKGTAGGGDLRFGTSANAGTVAENMRLTSAQLSVNGSLLVGAAAVLSSTSIEASRNISGATTSIGIASSGEIQSTVTTGADGFRSVPSTQATTFTLASLRHFNATQGTFGVDSVVTSQFGFAAQSSLTGATNNYGFFGNIASGTNRWNFYAAGTADNYFAGAVGIGSTSLTGYSLRVTKNLTGAVTAFGIVLDGQIQSDVTTSVYGYRTALGTQNAVFTLPNIYHVSVEQGTFGASSTVTTQFGVIVGSSLTGATNNYGFYGNIASGTGRWNLYMGGTAANYFAGSVGIGSISLSDVNLAINKNITGAVTAYGMYSLGAIQSDVTSDARYFTTFATTQAASFTLTSLKHYAATQGTFGASSVVTNQYGFHVASSLVNATNNFGFYSDIASSSGRWNFYAAGTASNYFNGRVLIQTTADTGGMIEIGGTGRNSSTSGYGITQYQTAPSGATGLYYYNATTAGTEAASFTLFDLRHYHAGQGTFGLGSSVTYQYGYAAGASLTGATNNYGFYTNIASGTGRWNFYANGTAANYFGGTVTIQTASATALAVGLNGATNPAFTVDSSTASQAAGFKITGAATGGTVALVATDSGSNTSLSFNAKGTGTISVGSVSTGDMIFGGTASAARRVEVTTNGLATFAYGDNSLPANITLQNLSTASTTNHGSSILWRTCTDSSATAINSGRIAVIKEQLWTSTASTQDSAMVFSTTLDGSMAEKMRISSAGNVGIGTSSPSYTLSVNTSVGINSYDGVAGKGRFVLGDPADTSGYVGVYRSAASTIGTAGNDLTLGSYGVIAFTTGAASFASQTERMRLDSNGYLLIGYTASNGAYALQVNSQIYATNATIATSDGKYKEDVTAVGDALALIDKLRPVTFKWKQHPVHNFAVGKTDVGFVAQDVKAALKGIDFIDEIVKENECKLSDGTSETFLGLADSKLIPLLVKAIQQLNTRLTILEAL